MATLKPSSTQSSSESRADAASPVIFGLFVGVVALVASEFVPVSLLTIIAADLGVTPGVAGQSVTAVGLSAVAASLLAASLFPKTNRRRILLASMLMVTLSNAVLALTNDVALHFAARAVLGLAVGTFWSMSTSTVERLVKPSVVAAALAIVYAGVSVATLASLPGAAWVESVFGWRAAFGVLFVLSLSAFVWQCLTIPSIAPQQPTGLGAFRKLLAKPVVRFGFAGTLVAFMGYHVVFTYLRVVLESAGVTDPALYYVAYALLNIAGSFVAGRFFARNFRRALFVVAAANLAVFALGWMLLGTPEVLGVMLAAGFLFGFTPVGWSLWLIHETPGETELSGGLSVAVIQLAIALAANVGGVLLDAFGLGPVFAASVVANALVVVLVPRALSKEAPQASGDAQAASFRA